MGALLWFPMTLVVIFTSDFFLTSASSALVAHPEEPGLLHETATWMNLTSLGLPEIYWDLDNCITAEKFMSQLDSSSLPGGPMTDADKIRYCQGSSPLGVPSYYFKIFWMDQWIDVLGPANILCKNNFIVEYFTCVGITADCDCTHGALGAANIICSSTGGKNGVGRCIYSETEAKALRIENCGISYCNNNLKEGSYKAALVALGTSAHKFICLFFSHILAPVECGIKNYPSSCAQENIGCSFVDAQRAHENPNGGCCVDTENCCRKALGIKDQNSEVCSRQCYIKDNAECPAKPTCVLFPS